MPESDTDWVGIKSENKDEIVKRAIVVGDNPDHDIEIDSLFDALDRKLNGSEAIQTVFGPTL